MPPSKRNRPTLDQLPEVDTEVREHPLFPPLNEDDDPPDVVTVQVTRWNKQTAQAEWCPRSFAAGDVQTLEVIQELFGGGKYELYARGGPKGNRLTARRTYTLPGKPKPLYDAAEEEEESAAPPVLANPIAVAGGSKVEGLGVLMALVPAVIPMLIEFMKSSAAERAAQSAATNQMMMGVMQTQQSSSQAFIAAMSQLFSRPQATGGGGASEIETFQKGIAFAENMIEGKLEAMKDQGGDSAELMTLMQQGLQALQMLKGNPPPSAEPGATG